ncbi:MAG: DUF998 domain-containing protein [Gemmatimonadota bacterium]
MLKSVSTRSLLAAGIAAGAVFPLVVLVQALTREGFDLAVHPLSMLSLGDFGWIQIANFVLTGLLFVGFAAGMRRLLGSGRGGRWGPRLIGFYGAVNVAAGVFTVDPMYGFPPGTPEGLPETLSWHAIVHNLTFALAFLGLIVAIFVFARRFASVGRRGFAAYSLATGLATPALIVLSQMNPDSAGYVLFGVNVMVNVWLVALALAALAEHRASERGTSPAYARAGS